jgi:hypothetical protein
MMDKDTFLMQLAWLLAHGVTTVKKRGRTYIVESSGTDSSGQRHRLSIPTGSIPWFDKMYKDAKKF